MSQLSLQGCCTLVGAGPGEPELPRHTGAEEPGRATANDDGVERGVRLSR